MRGIVIKSISGDYTVSWQDEQIVCKPRGVFRYKEVDVKVGDYVEFDPEEKSITRVFKRRNELERPVMANADKVFIIVSVKEPDLNYYLLDKMICIFEYHDIPSNIVFTKTDLLNEKELEDLRKLQEYYEKIGYYTYQVTKKEFDPRILKEIEKSICVVTGQSGVGKSTLLNSIDHSLNLKTDEISIALGRGKHTTRHIELFPVAGGWIADSPGFGNMDFEPMHIQTLVDTFREFWIDKKYCRFNDCEHIKEEHCYIKQKLREGTVLQTRYDNYVKFTAEVTEINKKYHGVVPKKRITKI